MQWCCLSVCPICSDLGEIFPITRLIDRLFGAKGLNVKAKCTPLKFGIRDTSPATVIPFKFCGWQEGTLCKNLPKSNTKKVVLRETFRGRGLAWNDLWKNYLVKQKLKVAVDAVLLTRGRTFLPHPCLATHTAGHYRRSSENRRLLIHYLPSRLRQLSAVWNLSEKYSLPSANAERHRTSRSRFFGI